MSGPAASSTGARYAIYAAPAPQSALWQWGSRVIGYDAATGEAVANWHPDTISAGEWSALTAEPRRYGFHGTLKAPFHLAPGASEAELLAAVKSLAATMRPLPPIVLEVTTLARCVVLAPAQSVPALDALASRVVVELEAFRAPLSEAERARRMAAALTPREALLLERYGYPYVLDRFRFHMTLTGPLGAEMRAVVAAALLRDLTKAGIEPSFPLTDLVVFRQPSPDQRFHILARAAMPTPSPG